MAKSRLGFEDYGRARRPFSWARLMAGANRAAPPQGFEKTVASPPAILFAADILQGQSLRTLRAKEPFARLDRGARR